MSESHSGQAGLPARAAALALLSGVLRKHRPLDAQLDGLHGLPPRDAGFARALASQTLRHFGSLETLLRHFVPKPLPPHKSGLATEILLLGACELLILNVPAHAAVDAANNLAASDNKAVHFKSLINAVLRRVAREGKALLDQQDTLRLNTPDWLWLRWVSEYGEETTRRIAAVHAKEAPLDIVLKGDTAMFPDSTELFGPVRRLVQSGRVEDLAGFAQGEWWVQDAAASLPVALLGDVQGKRVIDLCAAPGGKTLQLAAAGADVIAVELDGARLERVRDNLARTNLRSTLVESDARDFDTAAPFVLIDAPCTATGTIRRHPDLPWIKGAEDVTGRAAAAYELLESGARNVEPGGLLIFAVCSLEAEEGPEQVEAFLVAHPEFAREAVTPDDVFGKSEWISAAGDLRTLPCDLSELGGMDGFYAARLRKSQTP